MFPLAFNQYQLSPAYTGLNNYDDSLEEQREGGADIYDSLQDIFDTFILRMAVPKNRKTKGKKHLKHERKIPHKIEWSYCKRCGKPRRPHRVCTEFLEICAMREKDYKIHMRNKEAEKLAQQQEDT
jgi:ribosomal protein L32